MNFAWKYLLCLLAFIEATSPTENTPYETLNDPQIELVFLGDDITLKCQCSSCNYVYWKKKKENYFIVEEGVVMDEFRNSYEIMTDTNPAIYDLVIKNVNFNSSGTYFCARSMVGVSQEYIGIGADVIVVDRGVTCQIYKDLSSHVTLSQTISLDYDDMAVVNCSVSYKASESCQAIPLWHNLAIDKNVSLADDGFEYGIENGHAWLSINGSAQIQNPTQLKLSILFNCSNSENVVQERMPVFKTGYTTPMFSLTGVKKTTPVA